MVRTESNAMASRQRILMSHKNRGLYGKKINLSNCGTQIFISSWVVQLLFLKFLQVNKAQTLPTSNQPIYMSHDHVIQSPARTSYERSRSLTPDPSMRSANYAQNPIYGRMGISPERPPPPQVMYWLC